MMTKLLLKLVPKRVLRSTLVHLTAKVTHLDKDIVRGVFDLAKEDKGKISRIDSSYCGRVEEAMYFRLYWAAQSRARTLAAVRAKVPRTTMWLLDIAAVAMRDVL